VVTVEDAQAAILLMQKSLRQVGIDVTTGKIDIDIIMTGTPKTVRDRLQLVLAIIGESEKAGEPIHDEDMFQRLQQEHGLARVESSRLLEQLVRDGLVYETKPGYYKRT
jgi:replicative DNA helicase Mcm